MSLQPGDLAPDFATDTTLGKLNFHEWAGDGWVVLFSYAGSAYDGDELREVARLQPEFESRGVKLLGVSLDDGAQISANALRISELNFPLLVDAQHAVALQYGMLHPLHESTQAVRSVFVIDPARKIRSMITYPPGTLRDFAGLLPLIDAQPGTETRSHDWRTFKRYLSALAVSDTDLSLTSELVF
ncbi:MAG: redoxin domain-containing protein [Steroidobacteraceae bacterium]